MRLPLWSRGNPEQPHASRCHSPLLPGIWSRLARAPRLFALLGVIGPVAGLGLVVGAMLGETPGVSLAAEHASEARVAAVCLGLLTILQGILIVARHRCGLHLVILWSVCLGLLSCAWWIWSDGRLRFDLLTWTMSAGICCYAWLNRRWFTGQARSAYGNSRNGDK